MPNKSIYIFQNVRNILLSISKRLATKKLFVYEQKYFMNQCIKHTLLRTEPCVFSENKINLEDSTVYPIHLPASSICHEFLKNFSRPRIIERSARSIVYLSTLSSRKIRQRFITSSLENYTTARPNTHSVSTWLNDFYRKPLVLWAPSGFPVLFLYWTSGWSNLFDLSFQ